MIGVVLVVIITVLFTCLSTYLPGISKRIVDVVLPQAEEEDALRKEINDLRTEMSKISMVDEFARYSKKQRRINKLQAELDTKRNGRNDVLVKFKLGTNACFHVLQVVSFLVLVLWFRSTPLIHLPAEWTWPLGRLISIPCGVSGSIGVALWVMVCRSAVPKLFVLGQRHGIIGEATKKDQ